MTNTDFTRLSRFISTNYGIKMPDSKKIMLQSRLQSRLKANHISTFSDYCDFVFKSNNGTPEIIHLMDAVSTNKTDFFREPAHFDFLTSTVLPEFTALNPAAQINVWSAACSSGEEVYTLAMVMNEYLENTKCDYRILGTDISTRVLDKAKYAIYSEEHITPIPYTMRSKYLLRSKDKEQCSVRFIPEIRMKTSYHRLNLMDSHYSVPKNFDIIFCRNVLIYFDKATQEKVINKLCRNLKPEGYLLLGQSESTTGLNVPLTQIKTAVYKKHQSYDANRK